MLEEIMHNKPRNSEIELESSNDIPENFQYRKSSFSKGN
jgi:hypothetical protein